MSYKPKVAVLLPSLANKGSILVANDIVNHAFNSIDFTVFYFDEILELEFSCETVKLKFSSDYNFDGFDIVHSHGYRSDKFLNKNRKSIFAKRISTIHCDVFEDLRHSYNRIVSFVFARQWIKYLKNMDSIVTLTDYHLDFYSKYINKSKLIRIYNGRKVLKNNNINPADKILFDKLRNKKNFQLAGSCCVLNSRKGIDVAIRSLVDLKNIFYIIIGDGSEKAKLKSLAKKIGVEKRCFFLGYRKNAQMYMKFFDYYFLPSRSEAFPLTLIEASLIGLPVISSNIEVLKEVYEDDEVGFFETNDVNSFINAFNHVKMNYKSYSKKSLEKTRKQYTVNNMVKQYISLYEK